MKHLLLALSLIILMIAPASGTEYRHGVSFTIPHGTNMCDEPGDYKESGKACNTSKQVWSVRLWGEPREGWCLIVHWAGVPNKRDLEMAVWKGWVDCKDLMPIAAHAAYK